jgi:hypothetical protein
MGRAMGVFGTDTVPMRRLWKVAGAANRFQPEPCASETHGLAEATALFRACGRFCGIALLTRNLLDFSFARFFWKRVLLRAAGKPMELSIEENLADLAHEGESELANSMKAILDHSLVDMMMDGDITLSRAGSSSGIVLGQERTVEVRRTAVHATPASPRHSACLLLLCSRFSKQNNNVVPAVCARRGGDRSDRRQQGRLR